MLNTIQPTTQPSTTAQPTHQACSTLGATLAAAVEHARRLTTMYGPHHTEVAIAWEAVDELEKASRQTQAVRPVQQPTNFATYCSLNPNAPECRIYDV
jgi:hypothetical protein